MVKVHYFNYVLILTVFVLLSGQTNAQQNDTTILRQGLSLQLLRGYGETIIAPNPVEARLALGKWKTPKAGERVEFVNGEEHEWQSIIADSTGWFDDTTLLGCYVSFTAEMKEKTVVILEAMGNEMVYINGVPRSGNPYGMKETWEAWEPNFQYSRLPVVLEKGKNEFLFRCQRGRLKAKFYPPAKLVMLNPKDITIPDFIVGKPIDTRGAIVVVNASSHILKNLKMQTSIAGQKPVITQVPIIQPYSVRKIGFQINGNALSEDGMISVHVNLLESEKMLDSISIPFHVLKETENHKETFVSTIDGSVQYYGVNPASDTSRKAPQALFLTLHGAGVEGVGQSAAYSPKSWGHIVAPTNRRPYGYNWEDWGRTDALEVLDIVKKKLNIDESRIYLTGHSMGGHGVWHIGSLFPDQFAAIGPSAGWISFWTYRFRGQNVIDTTVIRSMIRRSTTPSETFKHINNYNQLGVYILHGSDDDNVSPDQARSMVEQLQYSHKDFVYHEQKGVGHWWDLSDEPGADCVDWAPMFDYFARHARPEKERIREIKFATSNPGISSTNNWATIDAQNEQLKMSSVDLRFDPGMHRFTGTTQNVARLALDLSIVTLNDTILVQLDSQKVTTIRSPHQDLLWIEQNNGVWAIADEPSPSLKGAHRYGTLKEAFRNRMMFVYGTRGSREENEWAFNKARYDAEKFWYQGNGSIDVVADVDFNPIGDPDRSIILYGNNNTNSAWNKLLHNSPVQVGNGFIKIAHRKFSGNNLSCIFVRPREGSRTASIAAISGTGIVGMRINNRLPYLSPGIGLPDCTVLSPDVLTKGESGVLFTGFFGLDWSVGNGDFVSSDK
jgi:fermentation-respiration switch protein FrsA (DUF1100 family)